MSLSLSTKIKRILMIICLCVFAGGFLVACGEEDDTIHVDGVTLNYETYKVVVGSKFQLVANVIPDEATNKKLYFRSGNTGVAFVDGNGMVTGVKTGTTQIFATSDDGKFEANCIVEVVDAKVKLGTPQNLRYDSSLNSKLCLCNAAMHSLTRLDINGCPYSLQHVGIGFLGLYLLISIPYLSSR